jgi:hypothetical protein
MIAPLQPSLLRFGAGVAPHAELVQAARHRFDGDDTALALAKDLYRRQVNSALRIARTSRLVPKLSVLSPTLYRALVENPEDWLAISVDDETFQLPKRATLEKLEQNVDLGLGFKISFDRHYVPTSIVRLVPQMGPTSNRMTTSVETGIGDDLRCRTSFVLWDYASERVLAVGSIDASLGSESQITLATWAKLEHEAMEQILGERPFVDN